MYSIKKKRLVDSIDRKILTFMYNSNRPTTGNQISKRVNLSPPAIKPRLMNLQRQGIVKTIKIGAMRSLRKKVKAPSRILWGLDFK